jgi:hypothetical protein
VVIDTSCGENTGAKQFTVFGVNFTGWKKVDIFVNLDKNNMEGYFAWSLRNVLRRGLPKADSTHYLNPISAGVQTCITVHKTKSQKLFQKQMASWSFSAATVASLDALADAYQAKSLPKCQLPLI